MSYRYTIETENPIVIDGNKMFNCNDGKLRLRIVEANPWHTGTPTEEGWYLMKVKSDDEIIYDTNYLTPCVYGMDWRYAHEEIIEWQKIEENEDD